MLIWIDESVLQADLASDHDACCGISGIFDAVYRGEHYALGNRKTLKSLIGNQNLSLTTRKIIGTILTNLPTEGGIAEQVTARINVTYGGASNCRRVSKLQWEVPLKHLGAHGVRKSVLLAENIEDARALEHAARQYQVSVHMPGEIVLERSGGGGSTTPVTFENLTTTEQRWCLCITDSDRLHPTANMSHTAEKCRTISDNDAVVAAHIDLSAREIENLLPIVFLDEAIPPTHREEWDWHIDRLTKLRPDAHKYCDIKSGVTLRKIRFYAKESPSRIYWESVARDLRKSAALTSRCVDFEECPQDHEMHCECSLAYGFGDKILQAVVGNLDLRTPHQSEKMARQDPNKDEWMKVGCAVFEWCCAPRKMRL